MKNVRKPYCNDFLKKTTSRRILSAKDARASNLLCRGLNKVVRWAVIFDADPGLCLSHVRTLGPKRNLEHRSFFSLERYVSEFIQIISFFERSSFKLKGETVFGIVRCYIGRNNIQASISAFWLVKSMSINPKSVQKSEIERKKVKLSAKKWNWVQNGEIKMIDNSSYFELRQTKWRTKIKQRLKLFRDRSFFTRKGGLVGFFEVSLKSCMTPLSN